MQARKILVAVAWPYANGPRHIGHLAGFGVPADVFARYQRMVGNNVLMVSGTDEHGTPIQVQADREGVTARELADRYNRVIAEDLQGLGLSYDLFTRTITRNHYDVVQQMFLALHRNGYLVPKTTMGAISPSTEPALDHGFADQGDAGRLRSVVRLEPPSAQNRNAHRLGVVRADGVAEGAAQPRVQLR